MLVIIIRLLFVLYGTSKAISLFPGEDWESGIIDFGNGGDDFFYVYVKSRHPQKDNRFAIWLNGGPGCTSMCGLLQEWALYHE